MNNFEFSFMAWYNFAVESTDFFIACIERFLLFSASATFYLGYLIIEGSV